jgi:hypothetical protein
MRFVAAMFRRSDCRSIPGRDAHVSAAIRHAAFTEASRTFQL